LSQAASRGARISAGRIWKSGPARRLLTQEHSRGFLGQVEQGPAVTCQRSDALTSPMAGLSRRKSRVRVPSRPLFIALANRDLPLSRWAEAQVLNADVCCPTAFLWVASSRQTASKRAISGSGDSRWSSGQRRKTGQPESVAWLDRSDRRGHRGLTRRPRATSVTANMRTPIAMIAATARHPIELRLKPVRAAVSPRLTDSRRRVTDG
jgi:hypothetical protein